MLHNHLTNFQKERKKQQLGIHTLMSSILSSAYNVISTWLLKSVRVNNTTLLLLNNIIVVFSLDN